MIGRPAASSEASSRPPIDHPCPRRATISVHEPRTEPAWRLPATHILAVRRRPPLRRCRRRARQDRTGQADEVARPARGSLDRGQLIDRSPGVSDDRGSDQQVPPDAPVHRAETPPWSGLEEDSQARLRLEACTVLGRRSRFVRPSAGSHAGQVARRASHVGACGTAPLSRRAAHSTRTAPGSTTTHLWPDARVSGPFGSWTWRAPERMLVARGRRQPGGQAVRVSRRTAGGIAGCG